MEMDCNLKKLANLFQVLLVCILEKSFVIPQRRHFIFSPWWSSNDFTLKKGLFVKYLSSFGQNTVNSS